MTTSLRFQRQCEGRVGVDIDPVDRVHLNGDGERHRRSFPGIGSCAAVDAINGGRRATGKSRSALFGGTGPHRNVEEHTVTGTPLLTGSGVSQE